MAENKVAFEVVVTSKGFKVVQQEQGKLAASLDNTEKKTKNLNKTQDKHYGRQKQGLIQTANSTKNFSKLSQTIGGGSGGTSLVGAYATLAANVFAASAAFNALSRAAEFEKLREGLEIVGNQSGRTLSILADNLREATGMALSLEQAMSAAAIGISGGFGEKELVGLAKVAKGASLTLGRSLPDAFDRLTRGAIKLEPEILDELGIMVRLDDAVEKYAATLNTSAGELTQMQRRQAFMNEILEQGTAKFGSIAEAVDPTPYQKLGAAFGDLTKNIFSFFNESLGLNMVVGLLANSTTALGGAMLIFGSTIATQIVPALGQMAEKTAARAEDQAANAKLLKKNADNEVRSLKKTRKEFKLGSQGYINAKAAEKTANGSLQASINKLEVQRKRRQANLNNNAVKNREQKKAELALIEKQIALETRLQQAQKGRGGAQALSVTARSDAIFQKKQARTIGKFTRGEIGLGAALAANAKEFKKKKERIEKSLQGTDILTKSNGKLKLMFQGVTKQLKILTTAFVKFLPLIGAIAVAIGIAVIAFDKFFNTAERKEFNKTMKELDTILSGLPKKAEEYHKALALAGPASAIQQRATAILSNQISEINDKLKEAVKNRKALDDSNPLLVGSSAITDLSRQDTDILDGKTFTSTSGASFTTPGSESLDLLENELNTRLPLIGDKARTAIESFFRVDESAEIKTLQALLTSDIPEYAKAAQDAMGGENGFAAILAQGDPEKALKAASAIVSDLQKKFGDLGGAVNGFATTLKDAEKVSSQFIQKFLPKTDVTAVLGVFTTLENGLEAIREEAGKAVNDSVGQSAAQLSGVGASVGTLLGGSFTNAQRQFNNAKAELDKANQDFINADAGIGDVERSDAQVKQAQALFEFSKAEIKLEKEGNEAITKTRANLKVLLKQELERKGTLETINALKKVEKGLVGKTAAAASIQNAILTKTLTLRKETFKTGNQILANTLDITKEEIKKDGLIESLKNKRAELVKAGEKDKEIAQIDLQLQEQKNIVIQEGLNLAQATFNTSMAVLAVDKEKAKLLERQNKLQNQLTRTRIEEEAFVKGRAGSGLIDTLTFEVEKEQQKIAAAKEKARIEREAAKIQKVLLLAQLKVYDAANMLDTTGDGSLSSLTKSLNATFADIDTQFKDEIEQGGKDGLSVLEKTIQKRFGKDLLGDNIKEGIVFAVGSANGLLEGTDQVLVSAMENLRNFGEGMAEMFGEDGAVIASLTNLIATLGEIGPSLRAAFDEIAAAKLGDTELGIAGISDSTAALLEFSSVASAFSTTLSSLASSVGAYADMKSNQIDKAIEKEQQLDGKSAESVEKIKAMEKKKTAIQRKAFEQQKKLQIASAIAATASAAAQAFEYAKGNPIIGGILAGLIIAAGMAQVAIIRKQQFSGGGGGGEAPSTALSIGGRSNAVDVGQRASGGELSYLRGNRGVGTNANNFTPGGAMGRKGYANGGDSIVVGERGPEVISPAQPIDITPNYALGGQAQNINFNISAVDGASVQNMLNEQQGNIISMIRQAANDNGEAFLESVDSDVYGGGS